MASNSSKARLAASTALGDPADPATAAGHVLDEHGQPILPEARLSAESMAAIKASVLEQPMPDAGQAEGAPAAAAAAFADGHVDPVRAPLGAGAGASILTGAPLMMALIGRMTRDERRALLADIQEREAHVLLTHPDLRAALEADAGSSSADGYILIVSATPGFRRAGVTHPSRAEYPLDFFTAEQLRQIRAEPQLQMVAIGGDPVPRPEPEPEVATLPRVDPLLAGRAAADAISRPPTAAEPGLRNAAAADGFRGRVGTFG